MSLLLDALQRASQDKAAAEISAQEWDSRLAPPLTSAAADPNLDLSEAAAAQSSEAASGVRAQSAAGSAGATPKVAQQIRRASAPVAPRRDGRWLVALMVALLVLVVGLGSFWLGLWGPGAVGGAAPAAAASAPGLAPVASAAVAIPAPTPVETTVASPVVAGNPLTPPVVADGAQSRRPTQPTRVTPAAQPAKAGPASPASAPAGPRFETRTAGAGALESAYAALKASRFDQAQAAYREILQTQPEQRDALLGMAYIAHQSGNRDDARQWYERVLRQDPDHPVALAGLLALDARNDLGQATSRARDVAQRHPDSAAAQTALGALLVKEGRLADARVAYARAQSLEPQLPSHTYNVAVALDQLHQYTAAVSQYERALALADGPTGSAEPGFSRAAVRQRLEQLRSSVGRQP